MNDMHQLRRELQAGAPHTHGVFTHMVPAMEAAAKNAGKKSFFGADKGAKALEKFLDTFKKAVLALYADEVVTTADEPMEVLARLSTELEKFAQAYPNWPDAYQFAGFFFSQANRHVHLQILQEARAFMQHMESPSINYGPNVDSPGAQPSRETDSRIKKVIDARKK